MSTPRARVIIEISKLPVEIEFKEDQVRNWLSSVLGEALADKICFLQLVASPHQMALIEFTIRDDYLAAQARLQDEIDIVV